MAKFVFFVVVVVALVALAAAEGDNALQQQCQRQLQESSLNACRQVVDQQLAVQLPFFDPRSSQLRTGVRTQCCQQLRDISPECRAAAVRQIVRQYEYQARVPLREDPYYPEDEEQQGGSYYPGEDEEQQGGSYYPSETYPQQEQGWEQQQQGGSYYPSETYPQQEQGWEQQQQGLYRPSQTYHPQHQIQGWYSPSQTYLPQQQQQGLYRPSQTFPQQQEQGSFYPSETFPQQQQGEGSFGTAQQQIGRQDPHRLRITIYRPARQQQEGQGQYYGRQGQQTGLGRFSSPPRFGAEQQARLRVVARARQVAAQLPAMCRLEGTAFSGSQY